MTTFDSTKYPLVEVLKDIKEGKIQLPDFQRGWVWDDNHVQDLLVSLCRSFPIGAIMLLETGGEVRFQTRPVEGLEAALSKDARPEKLILDGQQRLTTLTQLLSLPTPVNTRTEKKKSIKRHYYLDIDAVLSNPLAIEDAVIAVDEKKQQRANFGRDVALDLSTVEEECRRFYFPCDQILSSDQWETALHRVSPEKFARYMEFRTAILHPIRHFQVPVILLKKETTKEAVCIVFEKVNTGGVPLSVFELITASYAAEGYNLRDDWYGSDIRDVKARKKRLEREPLLNGIEATEFLQAISLLHTYERKQADLAEGKTGKSVRPVSAKRAEVLQLPLQAWTERANGLEQGFRAAAKFLRQECVYSRRELPYSTQIVPLAAVMAVIGDRYREPAFYAKLARWYWCGVLGELYGGAVETRVANDFEELLVWFEDHSALPRTIRDASFQPERFDSLRTRLSAAYKGIHTLVLREGSKDWYWKASIKDLEEASLDIHHIFPIVWCESQGIGRDSYDSILNKTPISAKANRKIGGDAPSIYIDKIRSAKEVGLTSSEMNDLLSSHALDPTLLREDRYADFIEDRRKRLSELIERAKGKPVLQGE